MPSPKHDDPNLCLASETKQFKAEHGWQVCFSCGRVLKPSPNGLVLRLHRKRSVTTRSLDKTRDTLLAGGIPPFGYGE